MTVKTSVRLYAVLLCMALCIPLCAEQSNPPTPSLNKGDKEQENAPGKRHDKGDAEQNGPQPARSISQDRVVDQIESTDDKHERHGHSSPDWWTIGFNVLLVLVSGTQACLILRQAQISKRQAALMERQTGIMDKQADIMEKSLVAAELAAKAAYKSQLPVFVITKCEITAAGFVPAFDLLFQPCITVAIHNYGGTRAAIASWKLNVAFMNGPKQTVEECSLGVVVNPGEHKCLPIPSTNERLKPADMERIGNGEAWYIVDGS